MREPEHIVEERPTGQPGEQEGEARQDVPAETSQATPFVYYGFLIAVYNALFAGFLMLYRRWRHPLERITPLDMTLLGLSTLRMAKLVSEDEITTVFRQPLIEVEHGERHPKGDGLRWALGKLVLCPTCSGTWIAALLTYSLHLFPRYTRPFLVMMSASGAEQFSDALLSLLYTDRDLLREREQQRHRAAGKE